MNDGRVWCQEMWLYGMGIRGCAPPFTVYLRSTGHFPAGNHRFGRLLLLSKVFSYLKTESERETSRISLRVSTSPFYSSTILRERYIPDDDDDDSSNRTLTQTNSPRRPFVG